MSFMGGPKLPPAPPPPPPIPTPEDPATKAMQEEAAMKATLRARGGGRRSTILTSGLGASSSPSQNTLG